MPFYTRSVADQYPRAGSAAVRRPLHRPERRIPGRWLSSHCGRAERGSLVVGRGSRRRDHRFCRDRLCDLARAVPDSHRPGVPGDAHARRSARTTGGQAGIAAPESDCQTFATDAPLRSRERSPARQRAPHHRLLGIADRGSAHAGTGVVVVGLDRRATARRRLHLARRSRDPNESIQRNRGGVVAMGRMGWTGSDRTAATRRNAAIASRTGHTRLSRPVEVEKGPHHRLHGAIGNALSIVALLTNGDRAASI